MSPLTDKQEKELDTIKEQTKGVPWNVYVWTVALFTGIIGFLYANDMRLAGRLDAQAIQYQQIQTQLSQIQTDLVWIKSSINK